MVASKQALKAQSNPSHASGSQTLTHLALVPHMCVN